MARQVGAAKSATKTRATKAVTARAVKASKASSTKAPKTRAVKAPRAQTAAAQTADDAAMAGLFPTGTDQEELLIRAFEIHVRRVLVEAIEAERAAMDMNKREFAEAAHLEYGHTRRLLTMSDPNPRVGTFARALYASKLCLSVTDQNGRVVANVQPGVARTLPA